MAPKDKYSILIGPLVTFLFSVGGLAGLVSTLPSNKHVVSLHHAALRDMPAPQPQPEPVPPTETIPPTEPLDEDRIEPPTESPDKEDDQDEEEAQETEESHPLTQYLEALDQSQNGNESLLRELYANNQECFHGLSNLSKDQIFKERANAFVEVEYIGVHSQSPDTIYAHEFAYVGSPESKSNDCFRRYLRFSREDTGWSITAVGSPRVPRSCFESAYPPDPSSYYTPQSDRKTDTYDRIVSLMQPLSKERAICAVESMFEKLPIQPYISVSGPTIAGRYLVYLGFYSLHAAKQVQHYLRTWIGTDKSINGGAGPFVMQEGTFERICPAKRCKLIVSPKSVIQHTLGLPPPPAGNGLEDLLR